MKGQVLDLQRVHGGQEGGGAPGEVEAEMVVADVDGAEVPALVHEEVDHVEGMEDVDDDDGVGDVAELAVLKRGEGEVAVMGWASVRGVARSGDLIVDDGENRATYISVQPIIPGRPLWNSFQSQSLPNRGLNSIPMKKSYITDPGAFFSTSA